MADRSTPADPLRAKLTRRHYLAFDYGTSKIGVAVGDTESGTASPLTTIRSRAESARWSAIDRLVKRWQPAGFVVGLAYRQDGSANPITQVMHMFAAQLQDRYRIPTHRIDETLSTFESKMRLTIEVGLRADKMLAVQDQVAAQLVLQAWLDRQSINAHADC